MTVAISAMEEAMTVVTDKVAEQTYSELRAVEIKLVLQLQFQLLEKTFRTKLKWFW